MVGRSAPTPYALRFAHRYGDGCWINDPVHPAGAVAYDEAALRRMSVAGRLGIAKVVFGNWSGQRSGQDGQDGVVLELLPATLLARRAFTTLGRVSPGLARLSGRVAGALRRR